MNNFLRAIIAGVGAKKLGGGCFSTVLIFIVIYYALGQCSNTFKSTPTTTPVKEKKEIRIDDKKNTTYYRPTGS